MSIIKVVKAAEETLGDIGEGTNILIKEGGICQDGVCDWTGLISWTATLLFFIAAATCFMFLIAGGIGVITSGGDKGKLESSKSRIIFAIVGMIVVGSSYAIWRLVLNVIGVDGSIETGL